MKKILITTGGSGGHVIPSLSLYDSLKDDFEVHITTDSRGSKYINNNYNFSLIDVPNIYSNLVGVIGFEPTTARPPVECATRLRHTP